jgi:hypothetical protein
LSAGHNPRLSFSCTLTSCSVLKKLRSDVMSERAVAYKAVRRRSNIRLSSSFCECVTPFVNV